MRFVKDTQGDLWNLDHIVVIFKSKPEDLQSSIYKVKATLASTSEKIILFEGIENRCDIYLHDLERLANELN